MRCRNPISPVVALPLQPWQTQDVLGDCVKARVSVCGLSARAAFDGIRLAQEIFAGGALGLGFA